MEVKDQFKKYKDELERLLKNRRLLTSSVINNDKSLKEKEHELRKLESHKTRVVTEADTLKNHINTTELRIEQYIK